MKETDGHLLLTAGGEKTHINSAQIEGDWLHVANDDVEMILPSSQIRVVSSFSKRFFNAETFTVTLSNKNEISASSAAPLGNYLQIHCCFEGYSRVYLFPSHRISSVELDKQDA